MTARSTPPQSELRILLLCPAGDDAETLAHALVGADLVIHVCQDADSLAHEIQKGAAATLIAEEALDPAACRLLFQVLSAQPRWFDLPVVILSHADPSRASKRTLSAALQAIRNAIILERPVRMHTILTAVRTAQRNRFRQYEFRKLFEAHGKIEKDIDLKAQEIDTIMSVVPAAVWLAHDRECRRVTGNDVSQRILNAPANARASDTDQLTERSKHLRFLQGGQETPPAQLPLQLAAAAGLEIRDHELTLEFEDGTIRHLCGSAAPVRDARGQPQGAVAAFLDITRRKKTERLVRFQARLLDRVRESVMATDMDGRIKYFSRGATSLYGYSSDEAVGQFRSTLTGSEGLGCEVIPIGKHTSEWTWQGEYAQRRKDGTTFISETTFSVITGEDGEAKEIIVIDRDITESRKARDREEFLLIELNHRVKNILALLYSLASQTIQNSDDLQSFEKSYMARLRALADVYKFLAGSNWEAADLQTLVTNVLRPYRQDDLDQVRISGVHVPVSPSDALALSMIFLELITNAVKYGALSITAGTVDVSWQFSGNENGRSLVIRWTEVGGPTVAQPLHCGFGTHLIEFTVRHTFGGRCEIQYLEEGLICEISIPWPRQTSDRMPSPGPNQDASNSTGT